MEINWKKTDGLEAAAGDAGYGIELEIQLLVQDGVLFS